MLEKLNVENTGGNNVKMFSASFAFFLNSILLVDLARMIIYRLGGSSTIVEYIVYVAAGAYSYFQIFINKRLVLNKKYVALITSIFFILFCSYIINSDISKALSYFIPFIIGRIIPGCYYCFHITEVKCQYLMQYLIKYRLVWILYAIIGNWYILQTTVSWNQYSMPYGYNLLIVACVLFYFLLSEKKPKYLLYFLIVSVFMLLRGSRGSLLCLIVFAFLYLFLYDKNKNKTKLILMMFVGAFLFLVVFFSDVIIAEMAKLLPGSRNIYYLTTNFFNDTGRSGLSDLFFNEIRNNPFAVRGVFSDRLLVSAWKGETFDITNYPHNLILELIYQFGIVFAILIIAIIVYCLIKSFKTVWNKNENSYLCLWLILFSSGLIRLFFSASYLTCIEFYLFAGICISLCKSYQEEE